MSDSEVAIVGLGGRFPGSPDIASFRERLRRGVESITFFSPAELASAGVAPERYRDSRYVAARGILERAELFDAPFFGLSPRDAALLDPQHRLLLECAWTTCESAGYAPGNFRGPVGVFAGASAKGYAPADIPDPEGARAKDTAPDDPFRAILANHPEFLATRISYHLDLTGPSFTVQSACSTSLLAVHLACQSLLTGDCEMALAGGVSVVLPETFGYLHRDGGILSRDGHCRAFDRAAAGFVGGNGLGLVLLKRLEDALADGDTVHAVIKGSAVANDGAAKPGFMAPGIDGQAAAVEAAQAVAGVSPDTLAYVEAHGTGTRLGDPVEIAALTRAFRAGGSSGVGFCAVGSVKTNIGHLNEAAGIAGLIKTVLSLKHDELYPSLHFEEPNPEIDFRGSPFYVNTELSPYPPSDATRRAGVSSFGIGGTNVHVVLEKAPDAAEDETEDAGEELLVISARTAEALEAATAHLATHLKRAAAGEIPLRLKDAAHTLRVGRRAFAHRRVLLTADLEDAAGALAAADPHRLKTRHPAPDEMPAGEKSVVFLFPGQGAKVVNTSADLYFREGLFRNEIDRAAEVLEPHLGLDLRSLLYPPPSDEETAEMYLRETSFLQPALFAVEHALARQWLAWGVRPEAMLGHSLGEWVAACLAGVFQVEDALALTALRAHLVRQTPPGAMLSVALPAVELKRLLEEHWLEGQSEAPLTLAAINGPSRCVVSGPLSGALALLDKLRGQGVAVRRLQVSHAFHSSLLDPVLDPFTEVVGRFDLRAPSIPFVSNVSGTWITARQATDPRYWARHLRNTMRFTDGLDQVLAMEDRVLLEVGPGGTLTALARRRAPRRTTLRSLPSPAETLGRLWLANVPVDFNAYGAHRARRRVELPTYPFERRIYRSEVQIAKTDSTDTDNTNTGNIKPSPERKLEPKDWLYAPLWRESPPVISDESSTPPPESWLLFLDGHSVGPWIAEHLWAGGHRVTAIEKGSTPNFEELLCDLGRQGKMPSRVVYLQSFLCSDEECDAAALPTFLHLLSFVQAWIRRGANHPFRLDVVSTGLFEVTGEERLCPERATLLGLVRTLPQELPSSVCRAIDLAPGKRGLERLATQLRKELFDSSPEPVVALRGRRRFVPRYEPVRSSCSRGEALLRKGGVYLITGGLGGLGLTMADYLARQWRARLVLVGRSEFPEPRHWREWLETHDEADEVSSKIRRLKDLEQTGAQLLALRADVSDRGALEDAVRRAEHEFGPLNGVIHAAGVGRADLLAAKTPEKVMPVFAPKIAGTRNLESIFRDAELDFLVLFSSMSALVGGLGIVDYVAANAFLDAFAIRHGLGEKTTTVSIAWDTWREVGMAAGKASETFFATAIRPAEGVEAFLRALGTGLPQIAVSTTELKERLARSRPLTERLAAQEERAQGKPFTDMHPRPVLGAPYKPPLTELEEKLVAIWQDFLGFEGLGVDDDFFELGGDSLLATQILARLRQEHGLRLTLHQFFDAATVSGLAAALAKETREEEEALAVEMEELRL